MFCSFTLGASLYDFKPDKSSIPNRGASSDNKSEPVPLRFPEYVLYPSPTDPNVPSTTPPPIDPTFGLSTTPPSAKSSLVPNPGKGRDHPFYRQFSKIRRLIDVTPDHLKLLNLSYSSGHELTDLLPPSCIIPRADTILPAIDSPEYAALTPAKQALLDRKRKLQSIFAERATELSIANADAFDTLARIRRDLKLGNMFRFYQTVELVAAYFDAEKIKKEGTITGAMPERFREELIKNFLEPLGWCFEMRYNAPRQPAKIACLNSLFQSRLDLLSYLPPPTNDERRLGILEGPIYSVQVRHDESFTTPSYIASLPPYTPPPPSTAPAAAPGGDIDMPDAPPASAARPLSPPSPPAAKRSKRSSSSRKKKEAPPAVDEFLGGPSDEKQFDARNLKELRSTKGRWAEGDVWDLAREVGGVIALAQERRKARLNAGTKIGRVRARVVGPVVREEEGEVRKVGWDEVWLVVCVHAHMALVKARVSDRYLRFLEKCDLEDVEEGEREREEWAGLRVQRSRWWCLVDNEERVDAAYAIGGVMERMCGDLDVINK